MGTPGSGLLASLRRKNKAPDPAVDESKFAARSAAVLAVEQAVATGAVPEPSPKFAKGVAIAPDGDFLFDLDETHEGEDQLDLKFQPVTRVASEYKEANLRQIAVSDEFITYGLKQGHIRVLHRFSEARALLKGHSGPVADLCFIGQNLLAAGGQNGELFVWKLRVHDGENAVHVEQVLHVKFSPDCDKEPVKVAAATDTTVAVSPQLAVAIQSAVILLDIPEQGAMDLVIDPLNPSSGRKMRNFPQHDVPAALALSPNGQYLAVGSTSGLVYICRIDSDGSMVSSTSIQADGAVNSVGWLAESAHGCTLCAGTKNGCVQTVYTSSDAGSTFSRSHRVIFTSSSSASSFIHAAVVKEQNVIVLADTPRKAFYTLHWSSHSSSSENSNGVPAPAPVTFDYLARFRVGMPVLNFTAVWNPDLEEEGTVELNCIQTEAVQQYFLNPETFFDADMRTATAAVRDMKPTPSDDLPLPSPGLANGRDTAKGTVQGNSTPGSEQQCTSPPPTPEFPAVTIPIPVPLVIPSVVPEPEDLPQPMASPRVPGTHPKLLTPTDILRRSATPEGSQQLQKTEAPSPADAFKVLQRSGCSVIHERSGSSVQDKDQGVAAAGASGSAPQVSAVSAAVAEEMSTVHRKFTTHVSAMYKELLKEIKREVHTQAAAQQAATTSLFREALAAQAEAVRAERAAVLAEERASMERLLSAISVTLNNDLPVRLQETVRAELAGLSSSMAGDLAPAVQLAVASALPKETSTAVKAALEKQLAGSLQTALTKPIQDSFRHTFTKQLVPSFENACQSMFLQIDRTFAKGFEEHIEAAKASLAEPASLAASLRDSLAMANILHGGGGGGLQRSASGASSAAGSMRSPRIAVPDIRSELKALVRGGMYEEAFSRALGMQDVDTVSWLCTQVDAATVLSSSPPALSQMVVLSLIQQLAADLPSGATNKLQWIREAAMGLNPRDVLLAPHLRPVLEQVHAALAAAARRLQGADASSCKLAMHVVHSQMTT